MELIKAMLSLWQHVSKGLFKARSLIADIDVWVEASIVHVQQMHAPGVSVTVFFFLEHGAESTVDIHCGQYRLIAMEDFIGRTFSD
jgi:hypothetical protein